MSEQQTYKTHRKFVPGFHYLLALLVVAILIGAVINLFKSTEGAGLYSASLILAIAVAQVIVFYYMRDFPLRAQDRVIRLEENLRHQARTGSYLDDRLTMRQIIALRFASDDEIDALIERAIGEGLSEDDIKKSIKNWRPDTYRV